MKKFLIGILLVVLMAMALAATTKPEQTAHNDTLKKSLTSVIGKVVDSHPLLRQYNTISTMTALNATDEYLKRNFLVFDHTFYNVGTILYQDMFIPVSVGFFGQVWLTVDEDDLQHLAERPEVMQMLGVEDALKQIKNKIPPAVVSHH